MNAVVTPLPRARSSNAAAGAASAAALGYLDALGVGVPMFAAALAAHRQGQFAKARSIYLELIDQSAMSAVCLHQLGMLAGQKGDFRRAVELIQRAVRADATQPLFYENLAHSFECLGDAPATLDVLVELGCMLQKSGRHDQAVPVYRRVLAFDPCRYAAHANLGTGLAWLGDLRAAVASLLRAVALHAVLWAELKLFLDDAVLRLVADGIVPADIAVPSGPPTGRLELVEQVLSTLGKALAELGYGREAIRAHELAVTLSPGTALAHWNLSLALLGAGEFSRGWREYEWRWCWDGFPEPRRALPAPQWRSEPVEGKTLFVYAEQGYGDVIQMAPLVPRLAAKAGRVVFEVSTPLVRLIRESFAAGNIAVVERPGDPSRIDTGGPIDFAVPLLSLPARLGLELDELPLARSYLRPATTDLCSWAQRLAASSGLKVGLVWAGRPTHSDDHKRSIALERLRPLFEIEGISWHSLQLGPQADQLSSSGLPIADLSPYLNDFADTAAAVAQFDLIVAVDTAVAHLAAAMGKPVWILLPAVADWRWLCDRDDSPWYPTVRLFRQAAIGDWTAPIEHIRSALADRAARPA